MFKFLKAKPKTTADEKIEKIIKVLFPPLDLQSNADGTKFHIDYSVDSNLDAALNDLEEGHNDKVVHNTIRGVADRLIEVRRILEAYREIDKDAKYFIVDDFGSNNNEEIQATNGEY
jgi:predicted RNA binding protein with dsRBD fold (UPF0201 family)